MAVSGRCAWLWGSCVGGWGLAVSTFSGDVAVRVAVRVVDGRFVAAPFAADGRPAESAMDFGPVGAALADVFERMRFVFAVQEIAG